MMNPYLAYKKSERSSGWTRIDMLLALYDKALMRLDQAEAAFEAGKPNEAIPHIAKAQLVVSTLFGGVRAGPGNETGINTLRLYEFVVRELAKPSLEKIRSARSILYTLRQGFEAIREEANALERSGRIPSGDSLHVVHARA